MEHMYPFFESIISNDNCNIVICDLEHTIIYMNRTAVNEYKKHGGEKLVGTSLLNCHNENSNNKIIKVVEWFKKSEKNNRVHTFYNEKQNKDVYMIALRNPDGKLIGYYEKHEFRTKDTSAFYIDF